MLRLTSFRFVIKPPPDWRLGGVRGTGSLWLWCIGSRSHQFFRAVMPSHRNRGIEREKGGEKKSKSKPAKLYGELSKNSGPVDPETSGEIHASSPSDS